MHADITGLHRVGLLGRDTQRLARRYRDLGFTLAAVPAGPHHAARVSARVGAASLDLLGVAAGPRPEVRRTGPRAEGLRLLDLGTGDAAKARRRLTEMGLRACADPRDGAAHARVLRIDPRQTPEASLGVAQVARRPVHADEPRTRHPNGARGIAAVLVVAADEVLPGIVDRYRRLLDREPLREGPLTMLPLGASRLDFLRAADADAVLPETAANPAAAHLAALTVPVDDADAARDLVEDAGIPTTTTSDGFFVAAPDAYGTGLFFVG
ncbi:VOC family protein [Nocardia thailandica]|uniref:VOC family protein n=1 Tax=Nocardia thailandica TaxID=257275 RepID=UPI00031082BF|nr:VOC family protein [Nocardia thailandica]